MECFLCLQTTNSAFNIFEGLKEGSFKLDTPGMIEKYTHFKPDKCNSMLCDKCWNTIESFHIFCLQIEEAHKNYRETKIDIEIVKTEHVLLDSKDNYFTDNVDIVENTLDEIIKTEYSESYTDISLPGCTTTNYKTEESLPNQYALYKSTKNKNLKIKIKKLKSSTEYEDYKCNDIQSTNNFKMPSALSEKITENCQRNTKDTKLISCTKNKKKFGIDVNSKAKLGKNKNSANNNNKKSKIMVDAADEKIAKFMTQSTNNFKMPSALSEKITENCQRNTKDTKLISCTKNKKKFGIDVNSKAKLGKNKNSANNNKKSKIMVDAADEKIAKFMTLSCQLCSETLPTLAALKSHYRIIHQQKGYAICCNKKFFRRFLLVDHIECHLNPAHFKCSLCDTTFTRAENLKRHMKVIHEETDKEVCYSYCDQCPKKYINKKTLARHKAYHLPTESWKFPCEECGKIFPHEFYLLSHKRLSHEETTRKICDICGKVVSAMVYKKHMQRHDSNYKEVKAVKSVKIKCHICNSFLSKIYMKVHLKNHEEANKDHTCPTCGKKSPNRTALYKHIYQVHRIGKAYPCTVCYKLFRSKDKLLQHIPFHTDEKKFKCTVCNSLFKFYPNLLEHKKREHPIEFEQERENRKKKLLENCITIENN